MKPNKSLVLTVTEQVASHRGKRKMAYKCKECDGSGSNINRTGVCAYCGGTGLATKQEESLNEIGK